MTPQICCHVTYYIWHIHSVFQVPQLPTAVDFGRTGKKLPWLSDISHTVFSRWSKFKYGEWKHFFVQRYLFFSLICSTLRSNLLDMSSDHEHAVFLDTEEFKGLRLSTLKILDSQTHFKPIKTFKYANFSSCHPCKTKKGFIKGEAFRRLRTNSVKENFNTYKGDVKQRLCNRAGLSHGARSWNLDWSSVLRQDKKLFVAKQRRRKKFYCLLPRYYHPRPYRILKRFSWNTGISV